MKELASMSTAELQAEIQALLDAKNIQKYPQTLAFMFDDLKSAEYFNSPISNKRADKVRANIIKFANGLKSRDLKTQAETLKENELERDDLIKRALIHASKVRRLSVMREVNKQREQALTDSIAHSESRVPFSQREEFRKLLVELQGAAAERVSNNDDLIDPE